MPKTATSVDKLVGSNIRIWRMTKGISQTELGKRIGLTFQQVQKYEKGANRVGAGRLFQIAKVLGVPVATLFEGVETIKNTQDGKSAVGLMAEPQSFRLAQAFADIDDNGVRRALALLMDQSIDCPKA